LRLAQRQEVGTIDVAQCHAVLVVHKLLSELQRRVSASYEANAWQPDTHAVRMGVNAAWLGSMDSSPPGLLIPPEELPP
jgi:hypothetical protein